MLVCPWMATNYPEGYLDPSSKYPWDDANPPVLNIDNRWRSRGSWAQRGPGEKASLGERVLACAADQLGISDLLALGAVVSGLPIVPKPFVIEGTSKATSIASDKLSKAHAVKIGICAAE